jgi:hypothetical protein
MRPARTSILVAAMVALLLVLPGTAMAQGAGEPEMMEDPIEAMEPEVDVAHPVAPVAPADDVAAQGNAVPEAEGFADGAVADDAPVLETRAALAPTSPVASGSGQLPFTGLDSGRLMQLFLVGSVLLSGGIVAMAWAGARTGTD